MKPSQWSKRSRKFTSDCALFIAAYGLGAAGGPGWTAAAAISVVAVMFAWGCSHVK